MDDLEAELAELEAEELDNQLLEPAPVPAGAFDVIISRQAFDLQCSVLFVRLVCALLQLGIAVVWLPRVVASSTCRSQHTLCLAAPPACWSCSSLSCACQITQCTYKQARRPQLPCRVCLRVVCRQPQQRRRRSWSWRHCRQRWHSDDYDHVCQPVELLCVTGAVAASALVLSTQLLGWQQSITAPLHSCLWLLWLVSCC